MEGNRVNSNVDQEEEQVCSRPPSKANSQEITHLTLPVRWRTNTDEDEGSFDPTHGHWIPNSHGGKHDVADPADHIEQLIRDNGDCVSESDLDYLNAASNESLQELYRVGEKFSTKQRGAQEDRAIDQVVLDLCTASEERVGQFKAAYNAADTFMSSKCAWPPSEKRKYFNLKLPLEYPASLPHRQRFACCVRKEILALCGLPLNSPVIEIESLVPGSITIVVSSSNVILHLPTAAACAIGGVTAGAAGVAAGVTAAGVGIGVAVSVGTTVGGLAGFCVSGAVVIHHIRRVLRERRVVNEALPIINYATLNAKSGTILDIEGNPRSICYRSFLRVLTLDGGGVRGLVTLNHLEKIEKELKKRVQGAKLRDIFDWIVGTSTGGLIAAGLCQGRSVDEIRQHYLKFVKKVFVRQSLVRGCWRAMDTGGWYSKRPLENVLNDFFEGKSPLEDLDHNLAVVTRNLTQKKSYLLSSEKHKDLTLTQCLRMTTAAPLYLPPVEHQGELFVDGGVGNNNPTAKFLAHVELPKNEDALRTVVVSVGTGFCPADPTFNADKSKSRSLVLVNCICIPTVSNMAPSTEHWAAKFAFTAGMRIWKGVAADTITIATQTEAHTGLVDKLLEHAHYCRIQTELEDPVPLDSTKDKDLEKLQGYTEWPDNCKYDAEALVDQCLFNDFSSSPSFTSYIV